MKNEAESQAVFAVSYVRNVRDRTMLPDLTVVLLWFSVACIGVRVSVMFHLTCVHIILVRFWLPCGK